MNNNRSVPSPQPQASQKQEQVYAQSQQDLSILASGGGTPPEQRFSDSASVGAVLDECDGVIQVESDTAEQINSVITLNKELLHSASRAGFLKQDKNRRLKPTWHCFLMAILLAIGCGRKDGSLIKDIHVYYSRVCAILHLTPCGLRTLERLFAHNSKCSKDQTESISKDLGYTLTSKVPDQFFHCPLTDTAFSILSVVAQRVSLGSLDEGEALLKTVQEKLPTIKRILLIDGSSINLAEGASAAAVEAGGAADSCKGLVGTNSRKIHLLLNSVTCGVEGYKLTKGVGDERGVLEEFISAGCIREGDLLIADAGYISADLFALLDQKGVKFICKGKQNVNPLVIEYVTYEAERCYLPEDLALSGEAEISDWTRLSPFEHNAPNKSLKFKQLIQCKNSQLWIDAEVDMRMRSAYLPDFSCRLMRLYNEHKNRSGKDDSPYVYIYSNLPAKLFSIVHIWGLSRARWFIELCFKANKQFCFMSGWTSKHIGRADFFILMALVAYHIKVLIAQQVQEGSGCNLSMLSACDVDESLMASYLGLKHNWYGNVDFEEELQKLSPRAVKTRAKIAAKQQRYQKYGAGAVIYDELLLKAKKARVSRINRQKLKSRKLIALVMRYFSEVPEITIAY